jgi:hypothetical protein
LDARTPIWGYLLRKTPEVMPLENNISERKTQCDVEPLLYSRQDLGETELLLTILGIGNPRTEHWHVLTRSLAPWYRLYCQGLGPQTCDWLKTCFVSYCIAVVVVVGAAIRVQVRRWFQMPPFRALPPKQISAAVRVVRTRHTSALLRAVEVHHR